MLTSSEMKALLERNNLGRIGFSDGFTPYILPINYRYSNGYILAHSRPGSKIDIMRQNPRVCFEVEEIHDNTNWHTVLAIGEYQEIRDERERQHAMHEFNTYLMHLKLSSSAGISNQPELYRKEVSLKPVIFRIIIQELTGRYEVIGG